MCAGCVISNRVKFRVSILSRSIHFFLLYLSFSPFPFKCQLIGIVFACFVNSSASPFSAELSANRNWSFRPSLLVHSRFLFAQLSFANRRNCLSGCLSQEAATWTTRILALLPLSLFLCFLSSVHEEELRVSLWVLFQLLLMWRWVIKRDLQWKQNHRGANWCTGVELNQRERRPPVIPNSKANSVIAFPDPFQIYIPIHWPRFHSRSPENI